MIDQLEEAIQNYLTAIVSLSDRKIAITEANLHYLTQRVYGAFKTELKDKTVSLQPNEDRHIILTLI